LSQLSLLLRLYTNPLKGFSRILDEGRLIFAALAAVAVLLTLQVPRAAEYQRDQVKTALRTARARVANAVNAARKAADADTKASEDDEDDLADAMAPPMGPPPVQLAVERFTARNPTQYFSPLIAMAVCFVPMVILVLTFSDNLGGFTTILFRDYMALLLCCLLAWTAPYLLLTVVNGGLGLLRLPAYNHPALWWAANAWFLVLAALAVRTLIGAKFVHCAGAACAGWLAGVGGTWLYAMFGGASAYLASPFVLYYLYIGIGPQLSGLGTGLRSRQRLKQSLENATLNPRDADAHYQLGLIYAQRRQYEPAIARFRKALEIDPREPDAHFQLGRIARQQGRYADAIRHCQAALRIDDRHASSEVWREIGIANLLAGEAEVARQGLEKYRVRHPYDPEGACWLGRTMAKLGQPEEARVAYDQAIEAVRTMPAARKRQVQSWETAARRERQKLPSSRLAAC
jgi:tetratricopeptide (TPR) repeat protein